jgi:hypothetical protein
MSERALELVAERQARRRRFNERLAALDPEADVARFRCECGLIACGMAIRLSADEYAEVRANERRFAVVAEHVMPEADQVVASGAGWVTIEKPAGKLPDAPPSAPAQRR